MNEEHVLKQQTAVQFIANLDVIGQIITGIV
jgi:hypothetical protein